MIFTHEEALNLLRNYINAFKPCPFCGEIPRVNYSKLSGAFQIWCETTDCFMNHATEDEHNTETDDFYKLLEDWNRREEHGA